MIFICFLPRSERSEDWNKLCPHFYNYNFQFLHIIHSFTNPFPVLQEPTNLFYWWWSKILHSGVPCTSAKIHHRRDAVNLSLHAGDKSRMRGPCRVCVGGKVILIDEEGVWSERILCLKWSSVNTEIPKIEQWLEMEAKEEGEERQDMNGVFEGLETSRMCRWRDYKDREWAIRNGNNECNIGRHTRFI